MTFVNREANWNAGASAHKHGAIPRKDGAAERSSHVANHFAKHLAKVDRSALRRPLHRDESCTAEIVAGLAQAHGVTVVAVTTDPELRAALTEVLPRNGIVFAESPEQVYRRPVPNNCAVLIVEHTLSRSAFERLKSHLKADAPALVNIMVGTHDDGSSLVGLLSAGWIDRFMVKPLQPGPTRTALRSALQQHHSLKSTVQVSDKPKIAPVAHASAPNFSEPLRVKLENDSECDLENVDEGVETPHESATRAAMARQQLPYSAPSWAPSWNLAFTAMIAVTVLATILVAWGMSTRAPEANVSTTIVNKIVADHLAAAQRAFELGSYVDPPGLSATHFYNAALELDPMSDQAKRGLVAVADRLIADSKQLIGSGDLLRAQSALDNVRRMQPNHRELADITASLLNARETERLTLQATHAAASSTVEPITVAAAAPLVVVKPSTNSERKVANNLQRQASPVQAEPRAVDKSDARAAVKSLGAMPLASTTASLTSPSTLQPRNTELNQEMLSSNLKRADEGKLVEPAQAETEFRSAANVAGVRENAIPEGIIASTAGSFTTGSGPGEAASATISKPTLIKYVPPVYPNKARAEGFEGWLDVNFVVTSDGRVINPRIDKGTLDQRFHLAALAAVSKWKFLPTPNGAAPNRSMNVVVEFRLAN
jgi:protein TonB